MASSLLMLLGLIVVLYGTNVVDGHILECYECASVRDGGWQNFTDLKKDPCWDPIAGRLNATKCPEGTSCYKQETILMDVERGDSTLSEKFYSISRYCGTRRFESGCSKRAGANSVITTCACTSDECNSAKSLYIANLSLSSLILLSSLRWFFVK